MVYIQHLTERLFNSKGREPGRACETKITTIPRNKNSVNENKICYLQVPKTVSINLNIHRGEAPNTKQKKL